MITGVFTTPSTVDPRGSCISEIYAGAGYTASRGRGRVQCCADALTEGAILMQDLCPPCFRWLVEATESYAGRTLPWWKRP